MNIKKIFVTIGLSILLVVVLLACYNYFYISQFSKQVEVQKGVDLEKFSGQWYDVASIPVKFQEGLINVTATYEIISDKKISVYNKGYKDGEIVDIKGKARVVQDGRLKVSFFPLVWSDYNIIYVDKDYNFAVIGGGNPDYFWVLSRTPNPNIENIIRLISIGYHHGYNVDKIQISDRFVYNRALTYSNSYWCSHIDDLNLKEKCEEEGLPLKDFYSMTVQEKIHYVEMDESKIKDQSSYSGAVAFNNNFYCQFIFNDNLRKQCFSEIKRYEEPKPDIRTEQDIKDESMYSIAIAVGDSSYCDYIININMKNECYGWFE